MGFSFPATPVDPASFHRRASLVAAGLLLTTFVAGVSHAAPGDTSLVAGPDAGNPQLSTDGRFVLFGSFVDLMPGNGAGANLFLLDRTSGRYEAINDSKTGNSLDGPSVLPWATMSGDGRYVIWCSFFKVLVRDRLAGTTTPLMIHGRPYRTRNCEFALNEDGHVLAFVSEDTTLVRGDTNNTPDIFVLDRTTHLVERISVSTEGLQTDFQSYSPAISSDGRTVAFVSDATNLVRGDTNNSTDLFIRDRQSGVTRRANGGQPIGFGFGSLRPPGRSLSADGRFLVFASYADVFVVDRDTGSMEMVSADSDGQPVDEGSWDPSISNDGRFVSFASYATTLVPGDYGELTVDVFVRDRYLKRTERASVWSSGAESTNLAYSRAFSAQGQLSGDGRFIAFYSTADLAPGAATYGSNVYVHETGGTDYWVFSVTPSRMEFGEQKVRTQSPAKQFTVRNDGTQPLPIRIELRGAEKAQFMQSTNCPRTLPLGGRCTISIRFAPTTTGSKSAPLKVIFDTGGVGPHPVRTESVFGTGVP